MATSDDINNLLIRRGNLIAELAAITVSKPDGSIDGDQKAHASNRASMLQAELNEINKQIGLMGKYKITRRGTA